MVFRAGRRSAVRAYGQVLLLAPAAFAVHQLRYTLAYGSATGSELQRTGHSYLHSVVPWLVFLMAVAAGCFLRGLGRALSNQTSATRFTVSFTALWLACTAALIGIFACQELLEGIFATGHPAGLAGVFGYGGWWSLPAAVCLGLVLAAVFHGARWVIDEVIRRCGQGLPAAGPRAGAAPRPAAGFVHAPEPLLAGWSSRGPPA
ncbi:MAG: hypothetical protein WAK93_14135 [Solirubrobacteraceae bacterium]